MTSAPDPDVDVPTSPRDLSGLVDELEERAAATVRDEAPEAVGQDVTSAVPGTPEPPD